jgi:hypothetical protein
MKENKMIEILGYENKYAVSEDGKVFSLNYNRTGEVRELCLDTVGKGYHCVVLCKNGKRKKFLVHRLVAQTFLDDWDPDLQVDHIDMNKKNNHVNNLRMVTCSQNCQNNKAKGVYLYKNCNKWRGELMVNYKHYYGPLRATREEALADRQELVKKYGTLPT